MLKLQKCVVKLNKNIGKWKICDPMYVSLLQRRICFVKSRKIMVGKRGENSSHIEESSLENTAAR